jgi:integrase
VKGRLFQTCPNFYVAENPDISDTYTCRNHRQPGALTAIFGPSLVAEGGEMAGTVQHTKLDSPTARAKLARGRQPHWQALVTGRAHLGYQRWQGTKAGRWMLRRYDGSAYSVESLGQADDERDIAPDGVSVLTFEQAKAKALATLDGSAEGKVHGRLTVRRAMANYIDYLKAEGRPTADTQWRTVAHITPKLGDIEVAALTSKKIRDWLSALAAAPALARTKKGAPQKFRPAPDDADEAERRRKSSANRVLTILKAALNHAFDEQHVTSNSAWGRRVKPFRNVEGARKRYLTVDEAKRLLNAADPHFRPLIRAALETGARLSELTRLQVQDFHRDAGTIHVRKSKTDKGRHIVLTDQGVAFFKQQCTGRPGSAVMFTTADGSPWRHQGRPMTEASERARLSPPVTFHALRHTWASLSLMGGVPLMVVSKNLGHADTRMVEKHYGHLADTHTAKLIRAGAPKFGAVKQTNVRVLQE